MSTNWLSSNQILSSSPPLVEFRKFNWTFYWFQFKSFICCYLVALFISVTFKLIVLLVHFECTTFSKSTIKTFCNKVNLQNVRPLFFFNFCTCWEESEEQTTHAGVNVGRQSGDRLHDHEPVWNGHAARLKTLLESLDIQTLVKPFFRKYCIEMSVFNYYYSITLLCYLGLKCNIPEIFIFIYKMFLHH